MLLGHPPISCSLFSFSQAPTVAVLIHSHSSKTVQCVHKLNNARIRGGCVTCSVEKEELARNVNVLLPEAGESEMVKGGPGCH